MEELEVTTTYRRYFSIIRLKCARMIRDRTEAQDLAQETFVRLWQQRHKIHDQKSAVAWIYSTSTHLAIDRIRRKNLECSQVILDSIEGKQSLGQYTTARLELQQIAKKLSKRELKVLLLSRGDQCTQAEIAECLRINERTVRRILKKIDDKLLRTQEVSV